MLLRVWIATMVCSLVLAAPRSAIAQESADEICPAMGQLAENIMQARQNKVPLSTAIDHVVGSTDGADAKEIVREVILLAYEKPAYSTEKAQSDEIADFRNDIEIGCYRRFSN